MNMALAVGIQRPDIFPVAVQRFDFAVAADGANARVIAAVNHVKQAGSIRFQIMRRLKLRHFAAPIHKGIGPLARHACQQVVFARCISFIFENARNEIIPCTGLVIPV